MKVNEIIKAVSVQEQSLEKFIIKRLKKKKRSQEIEKRSVIRKESRETGILEATERG